MLRDFTLRGTALQDFRHREEGLFDATFRQGKLVHLKRLPAGARQSLCLTPGFQDAHHHLLHMGLSRARCDLSGCASLEEAFERLLEYVESGRSATEVIWAVNYDESVWPGRRPPTREEIDRIESGRPVIMRRVCGHQAVLNSPALEEAGRRWGDRADTGILTEEQSQQLTLLYPPTLEELEEALQVAQDEALAMGITRVGEMGARRALETYMGLMQRGQLKIDVDLFVGPNELQPLVEFQQQEACRRSCLHLAGIKLFTDGSLGARTAALREPYADTGQRGCLLYDDETLREVLRTVLEAEQHLAIHAIGDAAVEQVLCAMEHGSSGAQAVTGRVRIEHAELLDDALLDRIVALDVGLSCQPNFAIRWGGPGGLYEQALGTERSQRANPFREIVDRRIPLLFGSDGMPMDPALGLSGAAAHPVETARLTAAEALRTYLGGSFVPGGAWEVADWWVPGCDGAVLYDCDPLDLVEGDLVRAPVRGVLWRGEWVLEPSAELFQSGVMHAD